MASISRTRLFECQICKRLGHTANFHCRYTPSTGNKSQDSTSKAYGFTFSSASSSGFKNASPQAFYKCSGVEQFTTDFVVVIENVLFNELPDYSLFKVFGCSCYLNITHYRKDKLSPKSVRCTFLGYGPLYKGYNYYDNFTRKIFVSINVTFDEFSFPFACTTSTTTQSCALETFVLPIGVSGDFFTSSTCQNKEDTYTSPDSSLPIAQEDNSASSGTSFSSSDALVDVIVPVAPSLPSGLTRSRIGISKPKHVHPDFLAHSTTYHLPCAYSSLFHILAEPKSYKRCS
ncbi:uncharacterized protein LOC113279298 [Papaver somniferum]|uniref:uncharacterized protein LOC113279298 n=1 Tax=Papaver somniferum TaxID=3469 RepID=UPI000E7040FF|nr:uncharacterized protein LOC113279298 [Papaver somniferum]